MDLIDFILNIAALLLWLSWRAALYDPLTTATPATLAGTLRRAGPRPFRRWHFLLALAVLLLLRAEFYHLLGPALNWTATLNLGTTRLAFRCDARALMLLYAALSFGLGLGMFLLWLLVFSLLARGSETAPPIRLARTQLGRFARWSTWKKLLLPLVAGFTIWWLLSWPLSAWGLVPRSPTEGARLAQAALVGLGCYLAAKYVLVALLGLHLLHNHIYFGRHPVWNFVDLAARRLLRPLHFIPLRIGKVNLAPLVGIVLVLACAHALEHGVRPRTRLDVNGRPERPELDIPGLAVLYERVSK